MNKQTVKWQSPSNIALVKYWGKQDIQIPKNASLSFTLEDIFTQTEVEWEKSDNEKIKFTFLFDGKEKPSFHPKLSQFFDRLTTVFPTFPGLNLHIKSTNNFPHSSGIASSASAFSALSLCVCSIAKELGFNFDFFKTASELARLGSGSASRSVFDFAAVWGTHPAFKGSSNNFAIGYLSDIHPVFKNYYDTVLLIDKGQKEVSSTVGHNLLKNHPFAKKRYEIAQQNMQKLQIILKNGDIKAFNNLVKNEALMLHALMMTSDPSFILMKPKTLAAIEEINIYNEQNPNTLTYTLDAGANVHVLYSEQNKEQIQRFIDNKLAPLCKDNHYICSRIGAGPQKL